MHIKSTFGRNYLNSRIHVHTLIYEKEIVFVYLLYSNFLEPYSCLILYPILQQKILHVY